MAVLVKNRILPWQKKPTPIPTPNPEAIHSDTSQELQKELVTMEPPDQPPSTSKEETPVELPETPDLTISQSPSAVAEKGAITNETTSTPEGQNPQSDKVVVVKPPTAAAYKM